MTIDSQVKQKDLDIRSKVIKAGIWKTCTNCLHWAPNENKGAAAAEACNIYKVKPPANVIVVGCVSHEEDIPF